MARGHLFARRHRFCRWLGPLAATHIRAISTGILNFAARVLVMRRARTVTGAATLIPDRFCPSTCRRETHGAVASVGTVTRPRRLTGMPRTTPTGWLPRRGPARTHWRTARGPAEATAPPADWWTPPGKWPVWFPFSWSAPSADGETGRPEIGPDRLATDAGLLLNPPE
jgi:hypothetical protein